MLGILKLVLFRLSAKRRPRSKLLEMEIMKALAFRMKYAIMAYMDTL